MNLQAAIEQNRYRQARRQKALKTLRAVRLKWFEYLDRGLEEKAMRIMDRCLAILNPR